MEKNVFIFDLYGTLVDIRTDEQKTDLWEMLCDCYRSRGVSYKPQEIEERYKTLVNEETGCLKAMLRNRDAEIELSHVFGRLLYEHPSYDPANDPYTKADSMDEIGQETERIGLTEKGSEITITDPMHYDLAEKYDPWVISLAGKFRGKSRSRLKLYEDTLPVLQFLKENNKKVYLLSNAQTLFTIPEMEECGLLPYFDGIFISSEQKIRKPGKLFMERLLRDFDIDRSQAVMIGNDMTSDMRSAMESGIDGVFLNTDGYTSEQIQTALEEQIKACADDRIHRGAMSEGEDASAVNFRPTVILSGRLKELFPEMEKTEETIEKGA